jgi:hypothetical protein
VALALTEVVAYTTGFTLKLGLRSRKAFDPRDMMMGGSLRFGIAFSDGRKAVTNNGPGGPREENPPISLVRSGGGGGGARGFEFVYFGYPLPPVGPITVAFEWPDRGFAEKTLELDGGEIASAGARSEVLWEDTGEQFPMSGTFVLRREGRPAPGP